MKNVPEHLGRRTLASNTRRIIRGCTRFSVKRTLLAAKSISYVDPASGGASGIHCAKVLDRLEIANG